MAKFETFKSNLLDGNLEQYGFKPDHSRLMPGYSLGEIDINYYGGHLCSIRICGQDLDNIVDIPEPSGPDDELGYRITDEAVEYLMAEIVREGGVIE